MSLNTGADILVIYVWLCLCFEHWRNQPPCEPIADIPKPPQQLEETSDLIDEYVGPTFSIRQLSIGISIALILIAALALASHF